MQDDTTMPTSQTSDEPVEAPVVEAPVTEEPPVTEEAPTTEETPVQADPSVA